MSIDFLNLLEIGQRIQMAEVNLGTSGWSYKEWEGVFYPKDQKKKLSYYAGVFNTTEIDSTFYAYPGKGSVYGWARNTPPGFLFTAKLPKLITHEKKLELEKGAVGDLFRFLDLMKPLISSGKLGPLLIQLPPSFSRERDLEKLKSFLNEVPKDVMYAVEFRNLSWLEGNVWELLREHNIANTIVDEPLMPPNLEVTADFAVVRWHGHGKRPWYNYRYKDEELKSWKPKLEEISKKTKRVYGYFNNHFHGFAVENSLKMLGILGEATPEQKEILKRVTRNIESGRSERTREEKGSLLEFMPTDSNTNRQD